MDTRIILTLCYTYPMFETGDILLDVSTGSFSNINYS